MNPDELIEVREVTPDLEQEVSVGWNNEESTFGRMLKNTEVFMDEIMPGLGFVLQC